MTASIDYDAWALKHDETRGVSSSVLGPLLEIRRDQESGRLRDVMAEYEPLSERGGDGAIFVAHP